MPDEIITGKRKQAMIDKNAYLRNVDLKAFPECRFPVHSEAWFKACFAGESGITDPVIQKISMRICRSYGIEGICDPSYIGNVIKDELKKGGKADG